MQQMFVDYFLRAKHYAKCYGYKDEWSYRIGRTNEDEGERKQPQESLFQVIHWVRHLIKRHKKQMHGIGTGAIRSVLLLLLLLLSRFSCVRLLATHGLQPTRLLRPWDFPGKSTGVGCHCLLQICLESFKEEWMSIINPKRFMHTTLVSITHPTFYYPCVAWEVLYLVLVGESNY